MIDVHSHLIPNVDDGSKSVKETFQMLEEAEEAGFTNVIITPHYLINYYESDSKEINFWITNLKQIVEQKDMNINIHSGMEIYVNEKMEDLIQNKTVLTLDNSRYLLMELPLNSKINYLNQVIFEIRAFGIIPIIAHPERYKYIQEDPKLAYNLVEKGCLLQSNYASILEFYGNDAKKTLKYLLKNELVSFLGSDCHKPNSIYKMIPKAVKKIEKIIGEENTYKITTSNPKKILDKLSI